MKLLLDQGLPRSTVFPLRAAGIDAAPVGEEFSTNWEVRRSYSEEAGGMTNFWRIA
jgi:hypothetical protein